MKILPAKSEILPIMVVVAVMLIAYNRVPFVGRVLGNPSKPAA